MHAEQGQAVSLCLDATADSVVSGRSAEIWSCTEQPRQRFQWFADGTVRAFAGSFGRTRCLTSSVGIEVNVATWNECTWGPEQQWDPTAASEIRSRADGRCLTVNGDSPADGTFLHVAPCVASLSQLWDSRVLIGYNLGFTYFDCINNLADDADHDNLSDACEASLAAAFSPSLIVHDDDDYTHNPYYAVQRTSSGSIQIFYMIAYHQDLGRQWGDFVFQRHSGDSEFISEEVVEQNGRWMLNSAFLSAHCKSVMFGRNWDRSTSNSWTQLPYAGIPRGRPHIFVSRGKHGNYASFDACNSLQPGV